VVLKWERAPGNEISGRASLGRRFNHHSLHCAFGVARTRSCSWRKEAIDGLKLVLVQLDPDGFEVLLQILDPLGAGNGHNVIALGEDPCQCKLCRCAALLRCKLLNVVCETLITLEIVTLKTGMIFAEVCFLKVLGAAKYPSQKSAAERAVCDKSNTEFTADWEDGILRIAASTASIRPDRRRRDKLCARGVPSPVLLRKVRGSAPYLP
jgi:hypothetical protein